MLGVGTSRPNPEHRAPSGVRRVERLGGVHVGVAPGDPSHGLVGVEWVVHHVASPPTREPHLPQRIAARLVDRDGGLALGQLRCTDGGEVAGRTTTDDANLWRGMWGPNFTSHSLECTLTGMATLPFSGDAATRDV